MEKLAITREPWSIAAYKSKKTAVLVPEGLGVLFFSVPSSHTIPKGAAVNPNKPQSCHVPLHYLKGRSVVTSKFGDDFEEWLMRKNIGYCALKTWSCVIWLGCGRLVGFLVVVGLWGLKHKGRTCQYDHYGWSLPLIIINNTVPARPMPMGSLSEFLHSLWAFSSGWPSMIQRGQTVCKQTLTEHDECCPSPPPFACPSFPIIHPNVPPSIHLSTF